MGRDSKVERDRANAARHSVKTRRAGRARDREQATSNAADRARLREQVEQEEDLDAVLAQLEREKAAKQAVEIRTLDPDSPPLARASGAVLNHPLDKDELILFGGACYDGLREAVYDNFYIYNVRRRDWREITSPSSPAPRCGHAAVARPALGGEVYVFGGEYASKSGANFKHYNDLWRFSIKENSWYKVDAASSPSPRSGHRMIILPASPGLGLPPRILLFGGFFDPARNNAQPKYLSDLHIFDLSAQQWVPTIPLPATSLAPSPRSAAQLASDPVDPARAFFLFGGFAVQAGKSKVLNEVWHCSRAAEAVEKWEWQVVRPPAPSRGLPSPVSRSGFAMASGSTSVLFYGGVSDLEAGDDLVGAFDNTLMGFSFGNKEWFQVDIQKGTQTRDAQKEQQLDRHRLATQKLERKRAERKNRAAAKTAPKSKKGTYDGKPAAAVVPSKSPQRATHATAGDPVSVADIDGPWPSPRRNAGMVIVGKTLYLYGGVREEDGDREVTLGDFYRLDLAKAESWERLFDTPEIKWKGEVDSSSSSESDS